MKAAGGRQEWLQEGPLLGALREAYEAAVLRTVDDLCQALAAQDPSSWPASIAEWVLPAASAPANLRDILLGPRIARRFRPGAGLTCMVVRERRWCEARTRVATERSFDTPMGHWHVAARATLGENKCLVPARSLRAGLACSTALQPCPAALYCLPSSTSISMASCHLCTHRPTCKRL